MSRLAWVQVVSLVKAHASAFQDLSYAGRRAMEYSHGDTHARGPPRAGERVAEKSSQAAGGGIRADQAADQGWLPAAAPPRAAPIRAADDLERGAAEGLRVQLPDVRPVHSAQHRHDLPDELPKEFAQRAMRWRAPEWPLRSDSRDAVRVGAGLGAQP